MSRIGQLMSVGRRSMMNSQTGLNTVGHNISSKDVPGYSRQQIEIRTNIPVTAIGKQRIGSGTVAAVVRRVNNPYLEKQIANEKSQLGTRLGRQEGLFRLEQAYNEQTAKGLNSALTEFFNSFRELSTNPESMPRRTLVRETAETLVNQFQSVRDQLREVEKDIGSQVEINVHKINSMAREMAVLNGQIRQIEMAGTVANDERDQRDQLLKELGQLVDIHWSEGDDGTVTVCTAKNALLVVGETSSYLDTVLSPTQGGQGEGEMDVVFFHNSESGPISLTERIQGGRLGGLLSVRRNELHELNKKMDQLAYALTREVNDPHMKGYNAYNETGVAFFNPHPGEGTDAIEGSGGRFSINRAILEDLGQIATAQQPSRPGDNRIALEIAQVQYKKSPWMDSMNVGEFYNSLVGELGVQVQEADQQLDMQKNIVKQLDYLRESISGVSLDEEATQMIEMQKQFDAAARLIRTADEVLETVIQLKRY